MYEPCLRFSDAISCDKSRFGRRKRGPYEVLIHGKKLMMREDAENYLRLLGQELQKKGVTGEILIWNDIKVLVGIKKPDAKKNIKAYLAGDETAVYIPKDINAYLGYSTILRDVAAQIAIDKNMSINWLDTAIKKVFDEDTDVASQGWLEYPNLRIYLALSSHIFAMQVATATTQDVERIQILAEALHLSTMKQALPLVKRYIPDQLFTIEMRLGMKQALKLVRTKHRALAK